MQDLPPYFREYMEQKFSDLHTKIDTVFNAHDGEILEIKQELHETRSDIKWLNQKVWMAIGALCIISICGTIFASYFKTMNKQQIIEAIEPLKQTAQRADATSQTTDRTLQSIIRNYKINVTNYDKN